MQGLPNIRTVDAWLDGDVSERFPQSKTMAAHNKGEVPGAELCLAPGINADPHSQRMDTSDVSPSTSSRISVLVRAWRTSTSPLPAALLSSPPLH